MSEIYDEGAFDEEAAVNDASQPPQADPDAAAQGNSPAATSKAKGVKQMVVGGVIAAAGVPMMVLPGPGVAAIAGGAALMGKGYQNFTGKEIIDEEMRSDPSYQEGQKAGEEWGTRVRDFAVNEVAPAGKAAFAGAKEVAGAAATGAAETASGAASIARQGFRAVFGDRAADKADEIASNTIAPAAQAAGSLANSMWEGMKPTVDKAVQAGGEAASAAGKKLADATRDLLD